MANESSGAGTCTSPDDASCREEPQPEGNAHPVAVEYGADISFPMHYERVSTNYPWLMHNKLNNNDKNSTTTTGSTGTTGKIPIPDRYKDQPLQPLGNKHKFYSDYVQGCVDRYGPKGNRCIQSEQDRVEMSLRQPQSMRNYTKIGFTKIRAPERVMTLLNEFWQANKDKQKDENWPVGNTYVNHWQSPSKMVSVEDASLPGGGYVLKQHIWNAARDTISEWTGHKLAECSLYGIRVYKEGAVLAPHVDRLPLVSSAIINVDQDVDEPWPLEVIGHDGKAHNVTMLPGDLVLYESHSILHGRPFPLKGRFMANVFIHFEPIGPVGGDEWDNEELPPYVIPGSPEESNWKKAHPDGYSLPNNKNNAKKLTPGQVNAHFLAAEGPLEKLKVNIKANPEHVNVRDANGWTPLTEAVRSGKLEVVDFLMSRGADVNARMGPAQDGASLLYFAVEQHGEDSEISKLLAKAGARSLAPGESE